jgi:hypothetical protein
MSARTAPGCRRWFPSRPSATTTARSSLASLLLVAVAACSNVAPDPQIASAAVEIQNSGG